jgi:hypothetical protein
MCQLAFLFLAGGTGCALAEEAHVQESGASSRVLLLGDEVMFAYGPELESLVGNKAELTFGKNGHGPILGV